MFKFGTAWNRWASRRPLLTLALTNGAMGGAGDIIAQSLTMNTATKEDGAFNRRYDPWRTVRFFVYGCAFAPVAFKWYSYLDRRFPVASISTASKSGAAAKTMAVCKRVAVDQIAFAPVAIAAFFTAMGIMEGKSAKELEASLRARYPEALVGNYVLWPAAQLVNFGLVPLIYRVPFSSLVSVAWNTYLSWVNGRHAGS